MNCSRCNKEIEEAVEIDGNTVCRECRTPEEQLIIQRTASLLVNGVCIDSFLGPVARCGVCNKTIVEGDVVRQQFIGTVKFSKEEEELGIEADSETLVHVECE